MAVNHEITSSSLVEGVRGPFGPLFFSWARSSVWLECSSLDKTDGKTDNQIVRHRVDRISDNGPQFKSARAHILNIEN